MSVYLQLFDDSKQDISVHAALADLSSVTLAGTDKFLVEDTKGSLKYTTLADIETEIGLPSGTEHYTLRYDNPNGWESTGLIRIDDGNNAIGLGGAQVTANLVNIESTIDKIQCYIESSATLAAASDKNVLYVSRNETIGIYDNTSSMFVMHRRNASTGPFLECINNSATVIAAIHDEGEGYFTKEVGINTFSPNAVLEVEDGGTSHDVLLKITADTIADVTQLVIGNDTFSTTDINGLRLVLDDAGRGIVENQDGVSVYRNLYLNPVGGNVGIGISTSVSPTEKLRVGGIVRADTAFDINGTNGATGTLTYDDGVTGRFVLVFAGGILTSGSVVASTSATMTWV